jgi:hypothetical protein
MMFVISEEKLMRFFAEMHLGFERDPGDVLIFAGFLCGFLLLLSCASWLQARKSSLSRAAAVRNAFRASAREKALRRPEIILLEKLSRYLKPAFEKLSLLRSGAVFNACARSLLEEGRAPRELVSRLRKKLGFRPSYTGGAAMRSGDLPEGISLRLLDRRGGNRANGRLIRNGDTGLVLELGEPFSVPAGAPIQVSCRNGFGVYVFPSVVRSSGRDSITVAHSGTVSRIQRRTYYRRKLAKPVYVRAAGSKDKLLRSALLDLSGGGASLRRTGDIFRENGALDLVFFISGENRVDLRARVVRLTPETAHVSFDCVPDPVRDRIIGYLFRCKAA